MQFIIVAKIHLKFVTNSLNLKINCQLDDIAAQIQKVPSKSRQNIYLNVDTRIGQIDLRNCAFDV